MRKNYIIEDTKTFRSNRIYFDEINQDFGDWVNYSVVYNSAKMMTYNLLYNINYNGFQLNKEDDKEDTVYKYVKNRYPMFDSYTIINVIGDATAILKSQMETFELNKQTKESKLDAVMEKQSDLQIQLKRFLTIKEQLINRSKKIKNNVSLIGVKFQTYQGAHHGLKDTNKNIFYINNKEVSLVEYETFIDSKIKKIKTTLGLLKMSIDRRKNQLEHMDKPKKICFGSRKLFKSQHTKYHNHNLWKRELYFHKYHSVKMTGRADLYYGNATVKYNKTGNHVLDVSYIDKNGKSKEVHIPDVVFPYGQDIIDEYIKTQNLAVKDKTKDRFPICYTFSIKCDEQWRPYIIVSVSVPLPKKKYVNYDVSTGVVSIDINVDHIALTELDKNGNLIYQRVIPFHIYHKNKGTVDHELSKITNEIIQYCRKKKKCLVVEKLDLEQKKRKLKYENKKYKVLLTGFAYAKIINFLKSKAYKNDIYIYFVNPAYTSQIGKWKYMKKLGVSIHIAAAYVIGRRGMGFIDKIPRYLNPVLTNYEYKTDIEIEQELRNKNKRKRQPKEEKDLLKEITEKQKAMHEKRAKRYDTKWEKYKSLINKVTILKKHHFYRTYKSDEIMDLIKMEKQKERLKYIK